MYWSAIISAAGVALGPVTKALTENPKVRRGAAVVGLGVAGFVAYRYGKNWLQEKRAEKIGDRLGDGTKAGKALSYANMMYQAIFTSGKQWVNDYLWDGTNEKVLFQAVSQMHDDNIPWKEVRRLYGIRYPGRDLLQDITNDLDADEYAQFDDLLNKRTTLVELGYGVKPEGGGQ